MKHGDASILDLLDKIPAPSPVLNVLRPLTAKDEDEIRQEGANWLDSIQQLPNVDAGLHARLRKLLIEFILQKFTMLTWDELQTILKLTSLDKTVVGQEFLRQGKKEDVLEVLDVRFEDVPSALKEVIEQIDDLAFLKKLHRQAITIGSLTAFKQALATPFQTSNPRSV